MRSVVLLVLAAATIALGGAGRAAQQPTGGRPLVLVAELDGIIHPISAEYLTSVIDQGDTSGAALIVFILRTPGGLLDSTQAIVSRMITSRAPIAVLVAPSGSRAASAGFVITIAADIAAMAPGTHIGAAHPVSGTSQAMDATMSEKAAADTAAYVRSLAEARGRNIMLAEEAVLKSRAFTDREALEAAPPLVDLNAKDVDELLERLDGRTIKRFDGRTVVLHTRGGEVQRIDMTRRQRFLGAIAHPQVAYILMTLGILGLTVEIWNPGAVLPGVAGGLCLLLAFFAFQILPVNTIGLLLILFGLALLILELKVPSFGALGIGGTVSLVVGSVMMTRNTVAGVDVGLGGIVPIAIGFAAIFLFLGRLALAAHRRRPVTGSEGMLGGIGRARDPLEPGIPGIVDVHGEMWRAVSRAPIAAGQRVRVTAIEGLTLVVELAAPEGASS